MRKYELLYILKHDSPPEKIETARNKFIEIIHSSGGMMIKEDIWGKKKLAFEVKKYQKGLFILLVFLANSSDIVELERNLKIHPEVLRYLTVKLSDKVDLDQEKAAREQWEAEMQTRREAVNAILTQEVEEPAVEAETGEEEEDDEEELEEGEGDLEEVGEEEETGEAPEDEE